MNATAPPTAVSIPIRLSRTLDRARTCVISRCHRRKCSVDAPTFTPCGRVQAQGNSTRCKAFFTTRIPFASKDRQEATPRRTQASDSATAVPRVVFSTLNAENLPRAQSRVVSCCKSASPASSCAVHRQKRGADGAVLMPRLRLNNRQRRERIRQPTRLSTASRALARRLQKPCRRAAVFSFPTRSRGLSPLIARPHASSRAPAGKGRCRARLQKLHRQRLRSVAVALFSRHTQASQSGMTFSEAVNAIWISAGCAQLVSAKRVVGHPSATRVVFPHRRHRKALMSSACRLSAQFRSPLAEWLAQNLAKRPPCRRF